MSKLKTKRIVLIVPAFPRASETFIVSKFEGLVNRGWDAHLVCYESDPEDWAKFPQLQADVNLRKRVHRAWTVRAKWLAGMLMLPALARGFISAPRTTWKYLSDGFKRFGWGIFKRYYLDLELICLKPDGIHFEFGAIAVGKTYLKDLLGCKLSVSFRGYDLNFSGLDQADYYKTVWEKADACHFLGEDLWQRALRRGCPADMPRSLISPAIDLSLVEGAEPRVSQATGEPGKPIRILSVGRLEWKKGYEFALSAIKNLKDMGVDCLYEVIGEGATRDALYFARHQLGLEGYVEFFGSLPHDKVMARYLEADIFLHSSVSEGFCNAVIEAQAVGVPVVCSDADGLRENIADGVSGFVVPRRDPQAMAEKMALLARDPSFRQKMGSAGQARVKSLFQLEQQLEKWERFFKELL